MEIVAKEVPIRARKRFPDGFHEDKEYDNG